MREKLDLFIELLDLKETQAKYLLCNYFKNADLNALNAFINEYHHICLRDKLIGTTYEKVSQVCVMLEIENKTRFQNKAIFEEWLIKNYKGKVFFKLPKEAVKYNYYSYDSFNNAYLQEFSNAEGLISLDKFGNLLRDGQEIEDLKFKELMMDFIFKNQALIGKNLYLTRKINEVKSLPLIKPYEDKRSKEQKEQEMQKLNLLISSFNLRKSLKNENA